MFWTHTCLWVYAKCVHVNQYTYKRIRNTSGHKRTHSFRGEFLVTICWHLANGHMQHDAAAAWILIIVIILIPLTGCQNLTFDEFKMITIITTWNRIVQYLLEWYLKERNRFCRLSQWQLDEDYSDSSDLQKIIVGGLVHGLLSVYLEIVKLWKVTWYLYISF